MQASFRTKLMLIVGTTTLAFALVILGGFLASARQARDLSDVEGRLVPKLELGPQLESRFEHLRQAMRDAVAAQDLDALEATRPIETDLLERLKSAKEAIAPGDAARLRAAIEDYYASTRGLSERLIKGETGEALLDAAREMQTKQEATLALLASSTRLDRRELASGFAAVRAASEGVRRFYLAIGVGALVLVSLLSLRLIRSMFRTLGDVSEGFIRFGKGQFDVPIPITSVDELGNVAKEANQMAESLRRHTAERDRYDWLKAGVAGLSDELRGELNPDDACRRTLRFLMSRLDALVGAFYLRGDDGVLKLSSHHGLSQVPLAMIQNDSSGDQSSGKSEPIFGPHHSGPKMDGGSSQAGTAVADVAKRPASGFRIGEGLVGRAAETDEVLVVREPPPGYLTIRSGLGESSPAAVVLVPFARLGKVVGVLELAFLTPCSDIGLELLSSIRELVAIALEAAQSRTALEALLEETRQQAERLGAQEEELRQNNDELQVQQEELRQANEELEAQRQALSSQNAELDEARRRVQEKAHELAKASEYKTQFLANMSHELRTPLNSMLLLSHLLAQNETKSLTPKQVEYAKTVHSAGKDLLGLINQLLDLAKIEAGRQEVYIDTVRLADLAEQARRLFAPLAAEKNLELSVEIADGLPETISSDGQRVDRILTNLVGNAIKFTDHGKVALRIGRPASPVSLNSSLLLPDEVITFAVSDTGIGIPEESRDRVFAAFEQVESRTIRRHGGTGLGLAIARESALLLGGELRLSSVPGSGSTFTLFLPVRPPKVEPAPRENRSTDSATHRVLRRIEDDRASLLTSQVHLLVIEDDAVIAEQLVDLIHARHLRAVVANTGEEGMRLAREHRPQGIILDVKLPDMDGWAVMEQLKRDAATSDIPVHFMSAIDTPERGLALGAIGYLTKPASRNDLISMVGTLAPPTATPGNRFLVVEDDEETGESLVRLLRSEGAEAEHVTSASAGLQALSNEKFRCMILDLGLPDMDGLGLLETLEGRPDIHKPPVVVHTARALTREETRRIQAYAEAVVLKDGNSEQRLLDEIRLFIRHVEDGLGDAPAEPADPAKLDEISLEGTTLLVADDDMRTVYALSALLRSKGADVLVADTGAEALELLGKHPDVQGVLMDVMMPEMDGYEAMRRLRQVPRFEKLPVIALTAKAMAGERERCIDAGASDYLAKPIDTERLLSTLGSWLKRGSHDGAGRGN